MAIYPDSSQLTDFLLATLPVYLKRKWQDLSQILQHHTWSSRVVPKMKVKGGTSLTWRIQTGYNTSFQHRGIGQIQTAQPENIMDDATVKWASSSVSRAWLTEEFDFNSGDEEIIDLMARDVHSMWEAIINGEEGCLWGSPTSSTENPRRPSGIPFWLQKASVGTSATAFGFNGGNPSGFTAGAADIDSTTVTAWKNGNGGYSAVSQSDLVPKLSEAIEKCHFTPPRAYAQIADSKPDYSLYTTYRVWEALQSLQTTSNDNLGIDVAKFRNDVLFKGIPVGWVPALSESAYPSYDVTNPIYGVPWNHVDEYYKTGWDWTEQPIQTPDDQPTARKMFMICWRNYRWLDRRQGFVFHSTVF